MRISDWSSDVCSSDLIDEVLTQLHRRLLQGLHDDFRAQVGKQQGVAVRPPLAAENFVADLAGRAREEGVLEVGVDVVLPHRGEDADITVGATALGGGDQDLDVEFRIGRPGGTTEGAGQHSGARQRSEAHTSELQSLMRNSYAVFCLKKKKTKTHLTLRTNREQ